MYFDMLIAITNMIVKIPVYLIFQIKIPKNCFFNWFFISSFETVDRSKNKFQTEVKEDSTYIFYNKYIFYIKPLFSEKN